MDKLNTSLHLPLQLRRPVVYCISKSVGIWSKEMVYSLFGTCGTTSGVLCYKLLYKTPTYYGEFSRDHQGAKGART